MYTQDQLVQLIKNATADQKIALAGLYDATRAVAQATRVIKDKEAEAYQDEGFRGMKPNNEDTRAAWIHIHYPEEVQALYDAKMAEDEAHFALEKAKLDLAEALAIVRIFTVQAQVVINEK